jgi:hypothetical protein
MDKKAVTQDNHYFLYEFEITAIYNSVKLWISLRNPKNLYN